MKRTKSTIAGGMLVLLSAFAVPGGGGQDPAPVGYISKDRVVELATAADGSIASFAPSPTALASLAALVDPVSVRMFLCASRPADLRLAAAVGLTAEAAVCPALSVEFIAVTEDLSEPKALISDNAVTKALEIIVYWMGAEVGRMHPEAGASIDTDLADFIFQARTQIAQEMILDNEFFKFTFHKDLLALDCKRCHGPAGSGLPGATN
ncbi:MAG: hypothetical protein WCC00_05805 [Candidatus Aminicenantales bacterium]